MLRNKILEKGTTYTTVAMAALAHEVSIPTIKRWAKLKKIKSIKSGLHLYVDNDSIIKFLILRKF
jgi:hypothetical protein